MNKRTTSDKFFSNCDRYLHHLNFAFTIVVFAAMIFYVSLNLFKGNLGAIDIFFFLMGVTGLAVWTALLGKLSKEEKAKHKDKLRRKSDIN